MPEPQNQGTIALALRKRGQQGNRGSFGLAFHRQEANVLRLQIRTQNQGLGLGLLTVEARGQGSKCVAKPKIKTQIYIPNGLSYKLYLISYILY